MESKSSKLKTILRNYWSRNSYSLSEAIGDILKLDEPSPKAGKTCPITNKECQFVCVMTNCYVEDCQKSEAKVSEDEGLEEWISVKDKLPEEDEEVLCVEQKMGRYSAGVLIGWIDSETKKWQYNGEFGLVKDANDNPDFFYITHWMPIPDFPHTKVEQLRKEVSELKEDEDIYDAVRSYRKNSQVKEDTELWCKLAIEMTELKNKKEQENSDLRKEVAELKEVAEINESLSVQNHHLSKENESLKAEKEKAFVDKHLGIIRQKQKSSLQWLEEANMADYWKKRCKAAEYLISPNASELGQPYDAWKLLKSQTPQ